ncbi:iron-sulfur cluster repair di-iron protein [Cytobacillus sp. IB215665]|uniref:iron-sulfur cluster repair di-iron protein n=1 Tax=Cytobacillus sp. IB215665 TaxID=3097357 RepID=UPI002A177105|nr:iron-sulfur cluster repair di-iron protein [Cytobacillus sp. IB215665]MDX8364490.1 iron-sulfur cluster repair di-iron protein [Cytobacillus sp. IB215665]
MPNKFDENMIVGEVVAEFPKASDIFKSYRIDFCCNGNRPIKESALERNVSTKKIIAELNKLYEEKENDSSSQHNWNSASITELINRIIDKHHRYLEEELPQLSPYVTKVMRVHGQTHPELIQVHKLFNTLKADLEEHLISEETELFPSFLSFERDPSNSNRDKIVNILEATKNEHDNAGDILKELRTVTNNFTPPLGACRTYQLVFNRLEELESDLFEHIHLENNILFNKIS